MLRPAPSLERLTSPCRQLAPPTRPPVYGRACLSRGLPQPRSAMTTRPNHPLPRQDLHLQACQSPKAAHRNLVFGAPARTQRCAGEAAMKQFFLLLSLLLPSPGLAQFCSIDWYKISGGGGASTGGTYQVSGTIGQHDAGSAMSRGQYSVTGGFWSLIAVVQTAGLRNLSIAHSGNSVVISWPNTASSTLQTNNNVPTA